MYNAAQNGGGTQNILHHQCAEFYMKLLAPLNYTVVYRSMQEKAGKVLTEANRAKTFRALLLRQSGCSLAYRWMWVWFRAHAHKNSQTSPKKICSRYRDGKRTEIRIGMEGATAS